MGLFLAYNLKLAVCFLLFYLIYKVLLSRDTFHRTNRITLLSAFFLTALLPFIPLRWEQPEAITQLTQTPEYLLYVYLSMQGGTEETVTAAPQPRFGELAILIYTAGLLFFTARYLYFTLRILLFIRKGKRSRGTGNVLFVRYDREIAPFSWMNVIFLSDTGSPENREIIATHELAHIRNRHYLDLLLAEFYCIIQWFNPAVWLLKKGLKDIHEYEADAKVLEEGFDARQYQLLLIKNAVAPQDFNSIINHFNQPKLKKRIRMMIKKKSAPWARLKYLAILPLAAFAVVLFARPEVSRNLEQLENIKDKEVSAFVSNELTSLRNDSTLRIRKEKEPLNSLSVHKDTLIVNGNDSIRISSDLYATSSDNEWEQSKNGRSEWIGGKEMEEQINRFQAGLEKQFASKDWGFFRDSMPRFEQSEAFQKQMEATQEFLNKQFSSKEWIAFRDSMPRFEQSEAFQKQMEAFDKKIEMHFSGKSDFFFNDSTFRFEDSEAFHQLMKENTRQLNRYFSSDEWKEFIEKATKAAAIKRD